MDTAEHDQQQCGVMFTSPPQAQSHPQAWGPSAQPGLYASHFELGSKWTNYSHNQAPPTTYDMEKDALAGSEPPTPPLPLLCPAASHNEDTAIQSTYLMRKTTRFGPSWVVACAALAVSTVTTYYSTRVMVDERELPPTLALSPGRAVLVVNILSKVVAFLCLSLYTDIIEALRWTLACRPDGILLTSFLAMSRATPIMGVVYLCRIRGMHQIWALQRFLVLALTFVVSIVLITDVTFKVVYTPYSPKNADDSAPTLQVVAGVAPVSTYGLGNISLTIVPIMAESYTMAFITDPRFVTKVAPVNCTGDDLDCSSILMPGGMESVRFFNQSATDTTEQPSLIGGNFPGDYDSIVVHNAPASQIEYQSISSYDPNFRFNRSVADDDDGDCVMNLKDQDDGLLFCQRQVGRTLFLGWSVCPEPQFNVGTCQSDQGWSDRIAWSTTVTMYSRRATVTYDRQNISIVSVDSLSPPTAIEVPALPFKVYSQIIMGAISQTLNRTSDPNGYGLSATQFSFGYGIGFILRLYQSTYSTYSDGGVSLLRSLIAVPFQFSTAIRQVGDPKQMPPENIGTASLSVSAYRAIIEPWTIWTFGFLSLSLTIWCMVLLLWMNLFGPYSPNVSFFPEIDITSKSTLHSSRSFTQPAEPAARTLEDLARLTRHYGLANGASSAVLSTIKGKRVYCGSVPGSSETEDHIVLATEQGRLRMLNKFQLYS